MTRIFVLAVLAATLAAPAGARPVRDAADDRGAALPRGAILFVSTRPNAVDAGWGLYAADAEGTSMKELSVGVGAGARWAPDGRRIAFGRRRGDSYDLYVLDTVGGGTKRVFRGGDRESIGFGRGLTWSPDGRRLAFTHGRGDRFEQGISVVSSDGRRLRGLTVLASRREDSAPAWSPDGRLIAFVRYERCGDPGGICGGLFAVRPDGTALRRIFTSPSFRVNSRPSWSPDGKHIAIGLSGGGARVIDVARRRARTIASSGSPGVAWAPNGRWLALADSGMAIVRPDGSGYRRISAHGASTPSWSPDSRAVAVSESGGVVDVWVAAVDGSGERRITDGGRYGYLSRPLEWNPRGRSTGQLRGPRVSAANPTDSVIDGGVLRTARPVIRLSADGPRVAAVSADDIVDSIGKIEAWDVEAERITRFPFTYAARNNPSFRSHGFAFAGERVATTLISSGGGIDTWTVATATLTTPRPVEFRTTSQTWPAPCCSTPLEHVAGDGGLVVVDAWGQCRISQGQPCAQGPKLGGRLLRVDEARVVQVASDPGALTLLSVDRDRILVDRENGALQLFGADGTQRYAITYGPARLLGAAIEGDDLVVLTDLGLADYNAATGDLRRERPLTVPDPRLDDVAGGVAVFTVGREIHLLRLRDEREAVIRPPGAGPVFAELERSGLFYAYAVDDAKHRGRIAFVPFDRLPLP